MTNRATHLEVSQQGHQTWYHSIS